MHVRRRTMGCMSVYANVWIDTRNGILRRGLVACVADAGFTVAGDSSELVPKPCLDDVDVLLSDIETLADTLALPDADATMLVALVPIVDSGLLPSLVAAGVAGYLVRTELVPGELRSCLETVVAGGRWYPAAPRAASFRRPATNRLTAREVAVLRLLADGSRTIEIAHALSYSERMVKNIVHDVMMKMECRTRAQAVAVVVRDRVI
jgi:DNA-binding NarL/FixJ family response regulator